MVNGVQMDNGVIYLLIFGIAFLALFKALQKLLQYSLFSLFDQKTPMNDSSNNYFDLFLQGRYSEGIEELTNLISIRPHCSNLFLTKALHQYRLGNVTESLQAISHALTADPLNYQAYFNLSSMMYNRGDRQSSFKNLVCANSSLNVLMGFRTKEESYLERAIELCFNNKEARVLKSLIKLAANKNIDALNQINYALYLDPSNPQLLGIQKRVYASMGMKELKSLGGNMKKKKYQRLETTLEVPSEEKFQEKTKELMEEFNRLVRGVKEQGSYIVDGRVEGSAVKDEKNHEVSKFVKEQESRVRWVQLKPVPATPSQLKTTIIRKNEQKISLENIAQISPLCFSRDKEGSTLNGSTPSQPSQLNQNDSLSLFENSSPTPVSDKNEPILQDMSFNSFSRFQNLSISNISHNSKIKVSRNGKNVLDISDCLINFLEESYRDRSLPEDSLNLLNDSRDSVNQSTSQKLELKLPAESFAGLSKNEQIVLAIQRVRTNDKGEKEEIEELYQIVATNKGLELRRQGETVAA